MAKLIDLNGLSTFKDELLNALFPVGAIYITTDANETITTLHNRLGGTWEALNSGNSITIPLSTNAPVVTGDSHSIPTGVGMTLKTTAGNAVGDNLLQIYSGILGTSGSAAVGPHINIEPDNLWADLSQSTVGPFYMFKRVPDNNA